MKLSQCKTLAESEVKQIHEASLDILENSGLSFESPDVRKILTDGGAVCKGETVYFPRSLIDDCIAKNRRIVNMCDREGRDAFIIGDGQVRFGGGLNAVFVMTDDKGTRRNSVLKDVE